MLFLFSLAIPNTLFFCSSHNLIFYWLQCCRKWGPILSQCTAVVLRVEAASSGEEKEEEEEEEEEGGWCGEGSGRQASPAEARSGATSRGFSTPPVWTFNKQRCDLFCFSASSIWQLLCNNRRWVGSQGKLKVGRLSRLWLCFRPPCLPELACQLPPSILTFFFLLLFGFMASLRDVSFNLFKVIQHSAEHCHLLPRPSSYCFFVSINVLMMFAPPLLSLMLCETVDRAPESRLPKKCCWLYIIESGHWVFFFATIFGCGREMSNIPQPCIKLYANIVKAFSHCVLCNIGAV